MREGDRQPRAPRNRCPNRVQTLASQPGGVLCWWSSKGPLLPAAGPRGGCIAGCRPVPPRGPYPSPMADTTVFHPTRIRITLIGLDNKPGPAIVAFVPCCEVVIQGNMVTASPLTGEVARLFELLDWMFGHASWPDMDVEFWEPTGPEELRLPHDVAPPRGPTAGWRWFGAAGADARVVDSSVRDHRRRRIWLVTWAYDGSVALM